MLSGRVIPFTEHSEIQHQPLLVVLIGRDPELLILRAKVINTAGYTVQFITPDQAQEQLRNAPISQVWVFCQTLELHESASLAMAIRRNSPHHKLLRLSGFKDKLAPGLFDAMLEPATGVSDLLRAIGSFAKKSQPSD